MGQIELNINTLKENKQLIFIIIIVIIAAFIGKNILVNQIKQHSKMNKRIKAYQKLEGAARDINKLSEELKRLKALGWLSAESVEIMSKINELVGKHGLEISSFDPGGFTEQKNYSTFSLNLDMKSDYFSFTQFLSEVEGLKELTRIISLKVVPVENSDQEGESLIRSSLLIKAFITRE
ncbi:type 4a pilus biogenesis protein PilO [Candidatus Omnitrophota bacterium]